MFDKVVYGTNSYSRKSILWYCLKSAEVSHEADRVMTLENLTQQVYFDTNDLPPSSSFVVFMINALASLTYILPSSSTID